MRILTGNSNRPLAEAVCAYLGQALVNANVRYYADHEVCVEIQESVRGEDIFVLQSTSNPGNDNLMELLISIDALRRGSARRITAVMPYYGYARQDRKSEPRSPISAKLVANLLVKAGADRVLTVDLHAMQIQGFFDIPTDNLNLFPVFATEIQKSYPENNIVIVSPDVGGLVRARALANRLHADLAIIDKRRLRPGESKVMNLIGDVDDRVCILHDDIVDSAGTLCNAADALKGAGARRVEAYVTHGVLTGEAVKRVQNSSLERLVISDSILQPVEVLDCPKISILSVAGLMGDAILRIAEERSISDLFI